MRRCRSVTQSTVDQLTGESKAWGPGDHRVLSGHLLAQLVLSSGNLQPDPAGRTRTGEQVTGTSLSRNQRSHTALGPLGTHLLSTGPHSRGADRVDASWPPSIAHTQQFPGSGTSPWLCLHYVLVFNWLADIRLLAFIFPQKHIP